MLVLFGRVTGRQMPIGSPSSLVPRLAIVVLARISLLIDHAVAAFSNLPFETLGLFEDGGFVCPPLGEIATGDSNVELRRRFG